MSLRHRRLWFRCSLLAVALLLSAHSASALVTVCASGCSVTTIQGAITKVLSHERTNSDVDPYIAVAGVNADGTGAFYIEALTIDGSNISAFDAFGTHFDHAFVQIYGDYDATVNNENGSTATVSASGNGHSALAIKGSSPVTVVLNHLDLRNGTDVDAGGGINFSGSGLLDLTNVAISNNHATNGGGIYANGSGAGIEIVFHQNVVVSVNTAFYNGGGIRIDGNTHFTAAENQTLFFDNTAGAFGGGVHADGNAATVDIGSSGYGGIAVIYSNSASSGGGIAATNGAAIRLFANAPGSRTQIVGNHAGTGGGVYVGGASAAGVSRLCANGVYIDGNTADASGAALRADAGTAFQVGGHIGLSAHAFQADQFGVCGRVAPLPSNAVTACPASSSACNSLSGNTALSGAIVSVGVDALFDADQIEMRGNSGLQAAYVENTLDYSRLSNCLIAGNTFGQEVVKNTGGSEARSALDIIGCTLAGNTLDAQFPVISAGGPNLALQQSIVDQPANRTLDPSAAVLAGVIMQDVITSDADLFDASAFATFSNVHNYSARFVDPANGDFHLRPESDAVDYAASMSPADDNPIVDMEGHTRPILDLRHFFIFNNTPYDIGAYELQGLQDLIFASGYDRPLN